MKIKNFVNSNDNIKVIDSLGCYTIMEYQSDYGQLSFNNAISMYYSETMGIKKRQVIANLHGDSGILLSQGAMQITGGRIETNSNIKDPIDLVGKFLKAAVTGESVVKPRYSGNGFVLLEPTYKHYLLIDILKYNNIVISDGMFLSCEDSVDLKVVAVKTLSGAMLGKEGIFNLCLRGKGVALLESPVPEKDLIVFELDHGDELKIDGSYAIMWDDELTLSVEKSAKSLLGSTVNGEGLVNVYRGKGCVWVAPTSSKI